MDGFRFAPDSRTPELGNQRALRRLSKGRNYFAVTLNDASGRRVHEFCVENLMNESKEEEDRLKKEEEKVIKRVSLSL